MLHLALLAAAAAPISTVSAAAPLQHDWKTYGNARFEFLICFPADLLTPQPEADNGDGRVFVAADGTRLEVWGTFNAQNLTPAQVLAQETARIAGEHGTVTYKASKPDWYALSGTKDGKVFYQRGLSDTVRFASFRLVYPKAAAATWNPVAARISACLKGAEGT
ncbi:hypothetical protein TQ38_018740 [Novosphingobium sp. P6W]|nr:hypothetical protein TQ38_018740 [Novosphingobium sp. P6W]